MVVDSWSDNWSPNAKSIWLFTLENKILRITTNTNIHRECNHDSLHFEGKERLSISTDNIKTVMVFL